MQTKAKSNSVITSGLVDDGGLPTTSLVGAMGLRFSVQGAGETILWLRKVSESNRQRAMVHGLVQKISDKAAIPRDTKTGLSATPEAKLAAMARLVEHLNSGSEDWSLRVAAEPRESSVDLLIKSLKELGFVESEASEAKVRGLTKAQRTALELRKDVSEKLVELRARDSGFSSEDTDSILEGLLGDDA